MAKRSKESRAAEVVVKETPLIAQRRTILFAGIALFLATFVTLAGAQWIAADYGLLADGPLLVAWLLSAAGYGALNLSFFKLRPPSPQYPGERAGVRGLLPSTVLSYDSPLIPSFSPEYEGEGAGSPSPNFAAFRCVTTIALGLGFLSLATLALGLFGVLNRSTAAVLLAAGILLFAACRLRNFDRVTFEERSAAWLRADSAHAWLWLLFIPLLALAVVNSMAPPGILWNAFGDPHGYDVVEYHLQIPREWYQAGQIFRLDHNVFSSFPFNVEMHYLLAMHLKGGPWEGMYLAQLMHIGFIVAAVLAIFAIARAMGAKVKPAIIAAFAAASCPWFNLLAPIAYNEGGLLLFSTVAIGWTILAIRDDHDRLRRFALAGVFAGLACGCKLTAVPTVLLAIPVIALLVVVFTNWRDLSPRAATVRKRFLRGRKPLPHGRGSWRMVLPFLTGPAIFFVAGLLAFSPWLIRNIAWSGNPVFPEAMPLLGKGHFSDVQVERWKRAHSPAQEKQAISARINSFPAETLLDWRYGFVILPLGVIAGAMSFRRGSSQLLLVAFFITIVFWIFFTHLQSRFFILGVPLSALMIAQIRWKRWPAIGAVLFSIVGVMTFVKCVSVSSGLPLGLTELNAFLPQVLGNEERAKKVEKANRITLIGDAKAFWYPTPPGGLHYRTVFDVDSSKTNNFVEAWRGPEAKADGPDDVTVIDPGELSRFEKTYWKLPPLPADMQPGAPYILPASP